MCVYMRICTYVYLWVCMYLYRYIEKCIDVCIYNFIFVKFYLSNDEM